MICVIQLEHTTLCRIFILSVPS